ncbi:MAG: membrane integrity-associated transporter subunit PqiC [Desulfobulbus sp.]
MNNLLQRLGFFFLSCWLVLALTCCSSSVPKINYYSLVGPPEIAPTPTTQSGRFAILIGPVSLPDILRRPQIVTGRSEDRYQLSENHRWGGELDQEFARALGECLAGELGTEKIALYPMGQFLHPTHQVIVDVLTLDGMVASEARLIVRWSLMDPTNKKVQVTRRSYFRQQPADKSYDAWVAAQRKNLQRFGQEISAAIQGQKT